MIDESEWAKGTWVCQGGVSPDVGFRGKLVEYQHLMMFEGLIGRLRDRGMHDLDIVSIFKNHIISNHKE